MDVQVAKVTKLSNLLLSALVLSFLAFILRPNWSSGLRVGAKRTPANSVPRTASNVFLGCPSLSLSKEGS